MMKAMPVGHVVQLCPTANRAPTLSTVVTKLKTLNAQFQ